MQYKNIKINNKGKNKNNVITNKVNEIENHT